MPDAHGGAAGRSLADGIDVEKPLIEAAVISFFAFADSHEGHLTSSLTSFTL